MVFHFMPKINFSNEFESLSLVLRVSVYGRLKGGEIILTKLLQI